MKVFKIQCGSGFYQPFASFASSEDQSPIFLQRKNAEAKIRSIQNRAKKSMKYAQDEIDKKPIAEYVRVYKEAIVNWKKIYDEWSLATIVEYELVKQC